MLDPTNSLLCVFSFNMGMTLDNCLRSIDRHCGDFPVAVADDASEDPDTLRVLSGRKASLRELFVNTTPKEGRRLGNLYANIQRMCDYAAAEGFRYMFMIQDDMQFVRPMDESVCREYQALLNVDDVLQVDPRFLRRIVEIDILASLSAYGFAKDDDRRSYADVGIVDLAKLAGWRFLPSERENKKALSARGFRRLIPFTPIMMHVPFPRLYRRGERRRNIFPLNRGSYAFHDMRAKDIDAMDRRDLAKIPFFRDYLRPKNMLLGRVQYAFASDKKLFA